MRAYFCIVMPWSAKTEVHARESILEEVIQEFGIDADFPEDQRNISSFDIKKTIEKFEKAAFVLADLSFERPSCYYELGIAESIGAKVFLLAQKGTPIHQTSYYDKVQFYENMQQFKVLVQKACHMHVPGIEAQKLS